MHAHARHPVSLNPTSPQPSSPFDSHPLADEERQRCEVWTRVMGYHRPVASFNIGKRGEFAERLHFTEPYSACP